MANAEEVVAECMFLRSDACAVHGLVDAGLDVEVKVGLMVVDAGHEVANVGLDGPINVCLVGPTNACAGLFNVCLSAVNAGLAAEVKVGHAAVHAGQGEGLALKLGHGGHAGHGGHGMEGEGQCGW